jgi:hypothetical protein
MTLLVELSISEASPAVKGVDAIVPPKRFFVGVG